MLKHKKSITAILVSLGILTISYVPVQALSFGGGVETLAATSTTQYACGSKGEMQYTAIDFGCAGDKCVQNNPSYSPSSSYCSSDHSAIIDLIYSVIKFLTDGVGLVIIASLVVAGIQYITSSGNPEATHKAMARIQSTVIALLIFIFAYAILNYVIPAGFFN